MGFAGGKAVSWIGCAISGDVVYPGCLKNYDINNMKINPSKNPYNVPTPYVAVNDADARVTEQFIENYGGQNPSGIMYMYIDKGASPSNSFGACPYCANQIAAMTYQYPGVTVCTRDRSGETWIYLGGMRFKL